MKRIIFNLVLAAVLNSLTESAKADTIVLQTTGANVVTEKTTTSPGPGGYTTTTSYSISFSTPSINIQNGSEFFLFEYSAPSGFVYSLPYGGTLNIEGAFFTNSALGINSMVGGTISISGLSPVYSSQPSFYGGVNGSDGFIYANSSIFVYPADEFPPVSFNMIQISIPIEGTGNNVNLGPENLNTPFIIGSNSMIIAELVPEPSALSLLAIGLGGLAMMRRRRS